MTLPLMPKATAVWLIEKTALTFTQIADFCGMHPLEVQAIADGEVAQGIVGYDPVANSQVTAEEIRRAEADPEARLRLMPTALPMPKRLRGSRYTPVAKRNDRPDGIAFLLRNYPQLSEAHYRLSLAYKRAGDDVAAKREMETYQAAERAESAQAEEQNRDLKQFLVILKSQPAAPP